MTARTIRVVAACALLLASCRASTTPPQPPLPTGPQVLAVTMDEYAFRYDDDLEGGRVLIRAANVGRVVHSLTVLPLEDDVPPIDQQLRGGQRRGLAPFAGVEVVRPGANTTFAVDLVPGTRYAFICFVIDAAGRSHARRGMASEFRARTADAPTSQVS